MEGIVLFNKPKDYTSYQIVEFFKKRTKKKVGHGETFMVKFIKVNDIKENFE